MIRTSEKIDQLGLALNKAQSVMESAPKSSTNPFYHSKFADLWEVWEACRKPLTENGLSFVQSIGSEKEYFVGKAVIKDKEGNVKGEREVVYIWLSVTSRLLHSSEQWIEDTLHIPVEADPQSIGKNTTYIRRYAMMSLCGITTSDDDGEAVRGDKEITQTQYPKYAKPPQKIIQPQSTTKTEPTDTKPMVETEKATGAPKAYTPKTQGELVGASKHYFNKNSQDISSALSNQIPDTTEELKIAWATLVKAWGG